MFFKSNKSGDAYKALGMVGGFGFLMGGITFVGYLIGSYLDDKFGTAPWLLIFFVFAGIATGFMEFYKTMKKFIK